MSVKVDQITFTDAYLILHFEILYSSREQIVQGATAQGFSVLSTSTCVQEGPGIKPTTRLFVVYVLRDLLWI